MKLYAGFKFISFLSIILLFGSLNVSAFTNSCYVNGYYKSNGTYVQGYYRSCPNDTVTDNYSYRGNTNPFTGSVGTNNYNNSTSNIFGGSSSRYGSGSSLLGGSPSTLGSRGDLLGGNSSTLGSRGDLLGGNSSSFGSGYGFYD